MHEDDVNDWDLKQELLDDYVQNGEAKFEVTVCVIFRQQSDSIEQNDDKVDCNEDAKLRVYTIDCALE